MLGVQREKRRRSEAARRRGARSRPPADRRHALRHEARRRPRRMCACAPASSSSRSRAGAAWLRSRRRSTSRATARSARTTTPRCCCTCSSLRPDASSSCTGRRCGFRCGLPQGERSARARRGRAVARALAVEHRAALRARWRPTPRPVGAASSTTCAQAAATTGPRACARAWWSPRATPRCAASRARNPTLPRRPRPSASPGSLLSPASRERKRRFISAAGAMRGADFIRVAQHAQRIHSALEKGQNDKAKSRAVRPGGQGCRGHARRGGQGAHRPAGGHRFGAVRAPRRRPRAGRGGARPGEDPARQGARAHHLRQLRPHPVHPGPHARRRHRPHALRPEEPGIHHPARAGVRQPAPRRRDQPRAGEDPGGAPRGDAGGAGHDRGRGAQARAAVHGSSPPRTRSSRRAPTRCPRRSSTASSSR